MTYSAVGIFWPPGSTKGILHSLRTPFACHPDVPTAEGSSIAKFRNTTILSRQMRYFPKYKKSMLAWKQKNLPALRQRGSLQSVTIFISSCPPQR